MNQVTGYQTQHLEFQQIATANRKTKLFNVNSRHGFKLGEIRWFNNWRQYTVYPEPDTVWNAQCLLDVIEFMVKLMEERKK